MRCSRCECSFSAESALVADHRYVQQCIDALKSEIKRLEATAATPQVGGTFTAAATGGSVFYGLTNATSGNWVHPYPSSPPSVGPSP